MTLADRQAATLLLAGTLAVLAALAATDPGALASVAALPAVALAGAAAIGAARGHAAAVLPLAFVAVFLIDAVFRVRDYQDKDVDFQVVLKLAVWAAIAGVALLHARRWIGRLVTPLNIPTLMFLIWLFATAALSPVPAYSAVAAFSILAYVLFSADLFATYRRETVFAVIVLAITAFCLVSLAVYVAVPEFGRYVYWVNEQRFVSSRLAGIAGSANNMGRIAAFALLLVALHASDFRRMHRLFVPAAVAICGLALVLTNSRTSMLMLAAIVTAIYLFRWRRLYGAIFLVSAALLIGAIAFPFGDQLLSLVSRSGSAEEITSVTGRTEIWYAVLKLAESQPWTGFGYGSSVFVLPQHEREVGFLTSHAHNLILQLLLTTGWVGVILFVLSVGGVLARALVAADRTVIALVAFVLLNGITESSGFTTLANICTFSFAMAVSLTPRRSDIDAHHFAYQRRLS